MLKFITTTIIMILGILAFSQDTYRDTLKLELEYQENGKEYLYNLIETEKKDYRLAVINNQLGLIYQYENNLDSAFLCHKKALYHAYNVNQYNQEIGVSYNKIGIIYYYRGKLDSAIIFFDRAIPFYQEKALKANSYNNLAIMNKYNSNPDVAIENYFLALDIYKELKDTAHQIYVLNNIGGLYLGLEDYEKSEIYVKKGLDLADSDEYLDEKYNCLSNLSTIYSATNKEEESISLLKSIIRYNDSLNSYQELIINKNNLASVYDKIDKKEESLKLFVESLSLMEETGLENNKEAVLLNVGTSYEGMNENEKALNYYQKSISFAHSNNLILRYEPIYKALSSVHLKLNNIDSSLYYKDLQIILKDSLDNVEKEKKMMELEAEHHTKELSSDLEFKEAELNDKERQRELWSRGFIYSVLILFFTLLGVILIYGRYKKKKILAEELTVRNKKNRASISELESTIDLKDEKIEGLSHRKETGKMPYPKNLAPLTEREKEVLLGVKDGLKDQEIADRLFLSIATIRTHLRKAYVKIDVRNRAEAISFITEFDI